MGNELQDYVTDIVSVFYILTMVLAILESNWLFLGFVKSKPEGRKTVLGKTQSVGALL